MVKYTIRSDWNELCEKKAFAAGQRRDADVWHLYSRCTNAVFWAWKFRNLWTVGEYTVLVVLPKYLSVPLEPNSKLFMLFCIYTFQWNTLIASLQEEILWSTATFDYHRQKTVCDAAFKRFTGTCYHERSVHFKVIRNINDKTTTSMVSASITKVSFVDFLWYIRSIGISKIATKK